MPINAQTLKAASFYLVLGVIASISFSISFFEITSSLLIVTAAAAMVMDRDKKVLAQRWAVFLAVYFLVNLLSATQTQYPADTFKGIFRVLRQIFLCVAVFYAVDSPEKFKKAVLCVLGAAFVISVDGLIQGVTGHELIRHQSAIPFTTQINRITATFHHSNDFSAYLTLTFFLFAGILMEAKKLKLPPRHTIGLVLGFLTLFTCLLWTLSRGAWVAIALALFILMILKRKKAALWAFAGVLLWAVFLSPPLFRERVHSLWDAKNGTIAQRKIFMQESFSMIRERPWLGFGINTFSANAPFYKSKTVLSDGMYVHNGYLQMMVETGIAGLLSFLAVIFYFFASTAPVLIRRQNNFNCVAGLALVFGVLAFLIHSATDTNLHSVLLINNLWLCMGLSWACTSLALKTPPDSL